MTENYLGKPHGEDTVSARRNTLSHEPRGITGFRYVTTPERDLSRRCDHVEAPPSDEDSGEV